MSFVFSQKYCLFVYKLNSGYSFFANLFILQKDKHSGAEEWRSFNLSLDYLIIQMLKRLLQNPQWYIRLINTLNNSANLRRWWLYCELNLCRTEQIKKAFQFSGRHHKSLEVNEQNKRKVEESKGLWFCLSWSQNLIYKGLIKATQTRAVKIISLASLDRSLEYAQLTSSKTLLFLFLFKF